MSDILETKEGGVLTIRFNRPEKKNAITQAMYRAIADAFTQANGDDEIRAVLIAGSPGAFTAGNDISDFLKLAGAGLKDNPILDFLRALATFEKPLIAAIDGLAIGVGTTLLMHCDLVFAADNAMLQTPFVDLGLVPEAGSSLLAPQIMGRQQAFALLALGEKFSATRAKEAGLVFEITSSEALENAALTAAQQLAAKAPEALAATKKLLTEDKAALLQRIEEEAVLFGERLNSAEAREAFMAFMEKRAPNFQKAS